MSWDFENLDSNNFYLILKENVTPSACVSLSGFWVAFDRETKGSFPSPNEKHLTFELRKGRGG